MRHGIVLAAISHSFAMQIEGAEILSGQVIEGGLIIARTDPSNQVTLGDKQIRIAKNGVFVLAFIETQMRLKRWLSPRRMGPLPKPNYLPSSAPTRFSESMV